MRVTSKNRLSFLVAILAMITLCFGIFVPKFSSDVKATTDYSEVVSLTNSDFASSPTSTTLDKNPSGWTKLENNSLALSGIINVSEESFGNNASSYGLEKTANPGKLYSEYDNKIFMINSKGNLAVQGYKSTDFTLNAYSNYKISVLLKNQDGASASIYLKSNDNNGNVDISFERVGNNFWDEYTFYVETGISSESVHLELWLGTDEGATSSGVSFFDHVSIFKYSKTLFETEYNDDIADNENIKKQVISRNYIQSVDNASFEDKTLTDSWRAVSTLPLNTTAKVINMQNPVEIKSLGYTYPGQFPATNNTNALILASKEKTAFGLKSSDILIETFSNYKITVRVKTTDIEGAAYVKLVENDDILNFYNDEKLMEFYKPVTQTSSAINSNGSSKFINEYNEVSFLVKGHPLYNTTCHLELWLGADDNLTKGAVIFDEVTIEKISSEELSNYTKGSFDSEITLTTITGAPAISNGTFNNASSVDSNRLVKPENITINNESDELSVAGIVNTYTGYYDAYKSNFGNIANPGSPSNSSTGIENDTNNILMLFNKSKTYQSVQPQSFTYEANKYYKFGFDFRTIAASVNNPCKLGLVLVDANGIELYRNMNISSDVWAKFEVYTKSHSTSSSITATIYFGYNDEKDESKTEKMVGWAMLDNLNFSEVSETIYAAAEKDYKFDMSGYMLDLTTPGEMISDSPAFTGNMSTSSSNQNAGKGGIFDGKNNIYGIETEEESKIFGLFNHDLGVYSLTSKYKLPLEADKYYKFSFKLQTTLPVIVYDKKDNITYGAGFELTGLQDKFAELISNDKFTTYTIYIKSTAATEVQIKMFLESANIDTIGAAYFYDFNLSEITEGTYSEVNKDDKTALVTTTSTSSGDNEEEPEPTPPADFNWLLIPSLILGAAIILAIAGFTIRHIKFKKFEIKRKAEYDRSSTLSRELVRIEAEKQRNETLAKLEKELKESENEIHEIEKQHAEDLKNQRKQKGKAIDKEVEKEFRAYANLHTRMQEAIDALKEKIEHVKSDDYLLSIQRKVESETEKRKKQIAKKSEEDLRAELVKNKPRKK